MMRQSERTKKSALRVMNCLRSPPFKDLIEILPRTTSLYLMNMTTRAKMSPEYCARTVPHAMPEKPTPSKEVPGMPSDRNMLAITLMPFTTRSVNMELMESCMPMNQPLRDIRLRVAGAAQTLTKKYSRARSLASGEHLTTRNESLMNGHCNSNITTAAASARATPFTSTSTLSCQSARPYACAVSPPVDILRNSKFQ